MDIKLSKDVKKKKRSDNAGRRMGDNMEGLKSSFWLKVIAILAGLMSAASALGVSILFSIYSMTENINEKAFTLNASVKTNTQINNDQDDRLDRHDQRFDKIDTKISSHEKAEYQWRKK